MLQGLLSQKIYPTCHYDTGITPSKIYDINQLQAMRLADAAWHEVDATTIRHCWHKAAILPPTVAKPIVPISSLLNFDDAHDDEDPITNAEKQVESALNKLELTGVLQASNRMNIEALLNPVDESQVMDETTDEDICQAVLDAKEDGRGDDTDDAFIEPCLTHHEVLQAASVINRYIDSVDNPVARKLESILASFRCQIQYVWSHRFLWLLLISLTTSVVDRYLFPTNTRKHPKVLVKDSTI
jgi:hypothetical protein